MAYRELRIIGGHGTGTDDYCVTHSAQAMKMDATRLARDVVRIPCWRGDTAIKTLTQLPDDKGFIRCHQG